MGLDDTLIPFTGPTIQRHFCVSLSAITQNPNKLSLQIKFSLPFVAIENILFKPLSQIKVGALKFFLICKIVRAKIKKFSVNVIFFDKTKTLI